MRKTPFLAAWLLCAVLALVPTHVHADIHAYIIPESDFLRVEGN